MKKLYNLQSTHEWVWYLQIEFDRSISMPTYISRYDNVADVSYRQNFANMYWQYLSIKAASSATLLFCMECSETQVVCLWLINAVSLSTVLRPWAT